MYRRGLGMIIWIVVLTGAFLTPPVGSVDFVKTTEFIITKFIIEMGGRFGHLKRFSESEEPRMILLIFIVCWGIAIIFVLGAIVYRIVIEPLIRKRKLRRNER